MVSQSLKTKRKTTPDAAGEDWTAALHRAFVRNGLHHAASAFLDDYKADPTKDQKLLEDIRAAVQLVVIAEEKKGSYEKSSTAPEAGKPKKLVENGRLSSTKVNADDASSSEDESNSESGSESDSDSKSDSESSSDSESESDSNSKPSSHHTVPDSRRAADKKADIAKDSDSSSESESESESESDSDCSAADEEPPKKNGTDSKVDKKIHKKVESTRAKKMNGNQKAPIPKSSPSSSSSSSSSDEASSGGNGKEQSSDSDTSESDSDSDSDGEVQRPGLGSVAHRTTAPAKKVLEKSGSNGKPKGEDKTNGGANVSKDGDSSDSSSDESSSGESSSDESSSDESESEGSSSDEGSSSSSDSDESDSGLEAEKKAARRRSGVVQNLDVKLQNVSPNRGQDSGKGKTPLKSKGAVRSDSSNLESTTGARPESKQNAQPEPKKATRSGSIPDATESGSGKWANVNGQGSANSRKRRRNDGGFHDRKSPTPFKRIREEEVVYSDTRLRDNTFHSKNDTFGVRAHKDLVVTRGKGFRKEKTKKKRLNHHGGTLSYEVNSFKFEDESD